MDKSDVIRIFNLQGEVIFLSNECQITIYDFLEVAGFKNCNPNKEDMLDFDNGTKGYKELIENGDYS